uniref:Small ribosomal subunit protein uS17c n=1 Tax=Cyanophora sudae TaxID=1522369 RepID=A0A2Z4HGD9_9EUKA|nr:ribosomal protein S17 [Cyanophora sudae]AWW13714.1 ribosomal protein S17 [Cyanophora sudae]
MASKERVGVVIRNPKEKTVVVAVNNRVRHDKYSKIIIRTKKYQVHDYSHTCKLGDEVKISEVKPISKNKRWIVSEVLSSTVNPEKFGD